MAVGVVNEIECERPSVSASWVKMGLVAGLVVALYADVMADLASEWWTVSSSSYGMLIPPLVFYIAYMRRGILFAIPVQSDPQGFLLTGLACLLLIGGRLAAEFFLTRISIVLLTAGLVWTFWGAQRLKALAFPLVLLATMVPLPAIIYNAVAIPLQLFASSAATALAQALGISIYCQGNVIHLATTSLGVVEACSGLQSLSALLVASLLVGFLENGTPRERVLLFLLASPLAILMNVFRITGTAILADYQPELAMGFYHSFSGWLVFVVGYASLWLMGKRICRGMGRTP